MLLNERIERMLDVLVVALGVVLLAMVGSWQQGAIYLRDALALAVAAVLLTQPRLARDLAVDRLLLLLAGYAGVATVSTVLSGYPATPLLTPANWLAWFAMGYVLARALSPFPRGFYLLPAIFAVLTFCLLGISLIADLALSRPMINEMGRLTMFFEAPTRLSAHLAVCFALAAGVLFTGRAKRTRIMAGILLALLFGLLLMAGSRGAMAASLASLIVAPFIRFSKAELAKAGAIVLFLIGVLALVLVADFSPELSMRARSLLTPWGVDDVTNTAVPSRMGMYRISWSLFADHPVLGNGFGSFKADYPERASELMATGRVQRGNRVLSETSNAHNFFLHLLAETGVIGALLLTTFFILLIIRCRKNSEAWPVSLAAFCLLLTLQLNYNLDIWRVGYPFMLFAGMGASLSGQANSRE